MSDEALEAIRSLMGDGSSPFNRELRYIREALDALNQETSPVMAVARALREEQPTMRDRFAIAALTGMLTDDNVPYGKQAGGKNATPKMAREAYEIADAMLKAREK